MRILFSCLVIFTNGIDLTPRDFAGFDEKLRIYQNMTGINDATFNEIWEAGITNGLIFRRLIIVLIVYSVQNYLAQEAQGPVTRHGSSQLIMARYGL